MLVDDPNYRVDAIEVIAAIGPDASAAQPASVAIVRSKHASVLHRIKAIDALASIVTAAVPGLTAAARDENVEIRIAAEKALKKLTP